jgi:hypothetical protein
MAKKHIERWRNRKAAMRAGENPIAWNKILKDAGLKVIKSYQSENVYSRGGLRRADGKKS